MDSVQYPCQQKLKLSFLSYAMRVGQTVNSLNSSPLWLYCSHIFAATQGCRDKVPARVADTAETKSLSLGEGKPQKLHCGYIQADEHGRTQGRANR